MPAQRKIDRVFQSDPSEGPMEVFVNGCNVRLVDRRGDLLTVEPGCATRRPVLEQLALATREFRGLTQYVLDLTDRRLDIMLLQEPANA